MPGRFISQPGRQYCVPYPCAAQAFTTPWMTLSYWPDAKLRKYWSCVIEVSASDAIGSPITGVVPLALGDAANDAAEKPALSIQLLIGLF